jgi:hypothetical protein
MDELKTDAIKGCIDNCALHRIGIYEDEQARAQLAALLARIAELTNNHTWYPESSIIERDKRIAALEQQATDAEERGYRMGKWQMERAVNMSERCLSYDEAIAAQSHYADGRDTSRRIGETAAQQAQEKKV